MGRKYRIGVIKGDGIGPEIMDVTLDIINSLGLNLELIEIGAGYEFYKKTGKLVEDGILDIIKNLDAVIKGPLTTPIGRGTFRSINLYLRQELDLYINVRPFRSFKNISLKKFNLVIIRENTEDLYVGIEGRYRDTAYSLKIISKRASERIIRYAFNYAIKRGFTKITVIHKANIMKETDGLFREVFFNIAKSFNNLEVGEMIVDAAAYNLVKNPEKFEVLVTPNLYGDILADLVAGLVGSLGLCGSAQIGDNIAIFEPIHGSAPDIAGKGIANPIGEIIAAKLMFEYIGDKYHDESLIRLANIIDNAISIVIEQKRILTPDLGGNAKTKDVGNEILNTIEMLLSENIAFNGIQHVNE